MSFNSVVLCVKAMVLNNSMKWFGLRSAKIGQGVVKRVTKMSWNKKSRSNFLERLLYGQDLNYFFKRSLISPKSTSSLDGAGGAAGADSSFFLVEFSALIIMKMANAMIRKSKVT